MRSAGRLAIFVMMQTAAGMAAAAEPYFTIQVVDEATRRGVPLVELKTVNQIRFETDSNGIVAFHEPGLMDRDVFFHVRSHGYEFPKDGFGFVGKALRTTPGGRATLAVRRINIAERLYRVTGGGIYRDSVLTGEPVPLEHPVLNAQVLGSDSVLNAVHRGRIYWFWGDTNRPGYPLGNFHTPGATSELPSETRANPSRGVDLTYFRRADGFAKPTAEMPGSGPTWIDGLVSLKESDGERMFASYGKVKPPLTIYERGLAEWNDEKHEFERVAAIPGDAVLYPNGHAFLHAVDGVRYVYFANPYPLVRVQATSGSLRDLSQYEAFTCVRSGSRVEKPDVDRNESGRIRFAWRRNAPALSAEDEKSLVRAGTLKGDDTLLRLTDRDSGESILAHRGSVYWNEYRKKWLMIAVQSFGTSVLGEVWCAEADSPEGPWGYGVKIVTHDKYSFYNPKQHPMFDQHGGRIVYFEGTYTQTFSGNTEATSRYEYNQMMYRVDLSDERLALPVAFGATERGIPKRLRGDEIPRGGLLWDAIAFMALDRGGPDSVPVFADDAPDGSRRLRIGSRSDASAGPPLFFALAPDTKNPPRTAVALWEFCDDRQTCVYSVDRDWTRAGFRRRDKPLCFVWRTPGPAARESGRP
ncbi:MAG: hypothetical protein IT428_24565 [Planctomycetaceae bacterium]|nr:hypothetical protein [Planctomycetaceae bacterium]